MMLRENFNKKKLHFIDTAVFKQIHNVLNKVVKENDKNCLIISYEIQQLIELFTGFEKLYCFDLNEKFIKSQKDNLIYVDFFEDLKDVNIDVIMFFETNFDENTLKIYLEQCHKLLKGKGKLILINLMSEIRSKAADDLIYYETYLKNIIFPGFKINLKKPLNYDPISQNKSINNPEYIKPFVIAGIKDEFKIKNYEKGDEHKINEMFHRIFGVQRSLKAWNWKFKDNPFGKYEIKLCIDKNNEIVGHYSGYYAPLDIDGIVKKCVQVGDIMTEKRVRNKGLGENGILARLATCFFLDLSFQEVPFAYGFNTATSRKISEKFTKVQYFDNDYVNFYETNNIDIKFKLLLKLKYNFEEINEFDERFDKLYSKIRKHYPKLIIKRDSKYLNWRYSNPDKNYNTVVIKKSSKPVGYFVYSVINENTVEIGDIFIDKKSDILDAILLYFSEKFYTNIICWLSKEPEWLNNLFLKKDFIRNVEPNYLSLGFRILDERFDKENMKHFYYTKSDSDLF